MIEQGTPEQFKDSVLGNIGFSVTPALLRRVRMTLEAEDFKVIQVFLTTTLSKMTTIVAFVVINRQPDGALAKVIRATRAARLSLYQFEPQATGSVLTTYRVELRGNE
jgi:hypothetical protein